MKLYKTTIIPTSNFITSLKGDTLFGQICWAIRYKYGEESLKELLKEYETKPFLIVSDGFASGYLPKPTLPSSLLDENSDDKKQNRKNIWLTLEQLKDGKYNEAITNEEASNIDKTEAIVRNSINYKTSTTGDGFDPHSEIEQSLSKKDIYFLCDDNFSKENLYEIVQLVSQMGYGKDSSTGKGRFEIDSIELIELDNNSKTFITLSPFVADGMKCKNIFYEPFTRFGKSGANRANKNPFKKPILMANSGAVIEFDSKEKFQYIGKAIKNISTYEDIVHQGYSILLPLKDLDYE
ncbi:MAG: hypothetical protein U9Q30_05175, partial [Campylobacterota bacterium]|nr:hypothetical protein [Campylobacterota bacterium]